MRRLVLFIQIVLQALGTGCVAGGFMCLVAPQIPGVWGQVALIGVGLLLLLAAVPFGYGDERD